MGQAINDFYEGTPAWRVFFPVLVTGWETLRPVLDRWGIEAPEILDADTVAQAVAALKDDRIAQRLTEATARVSLKDLSEAAAVDRLATSWVVLATWGARYERRRRERKPTGYAWIRAGEALGQLQSDLAEYGPIIG